MVPAFFDVASTRKGFLKIKMLGIRLSFWRVKVFSLHTLGRNPPRRDPVVVKASLDNHAFIDLSYAQERTAHSLLSTRSPALILIFAFAATMVFLQCFFNAFVFRTVFVTSSIVVRGQS